MFLAGVCPPMRRPQFFISLRLPPCTVLKRVAGVQVHLFREASSSASGLHCQLAVQLGHITLDASYTVVPFMCHVPELVALVWLSCVCGAVAYPLSRRHISPPSSGLVDPKRDFAKSSCA